MFLYGTIEVWPRWAHHLTHLNHLFLVINSSSNIIITEAQSFGSHGIENERDGNTIDQEVTYIRLCRPIWSEDPESELLCATFLCCSLLFETCNHEHP